MQRRRSGPSVPLVKLFGVTTQAFEPVERRADCKLPSSEDVLDGNRVLDIAAAAGDNDMYEVTPKKLQKRRREAARCLG